MPVQVPAEFAQFVSQLLGRSDDRLPGGWRREGWIA
jgi:hypothetical protein